MLLISIPSLILAYIKLRKRNLGPILDANGWAVNAKAKINVPFGKSLTQIGKLPADAKRNLTDPFAEKKRPWKFYITLLIILVAAICWYLGKIDKYLPTKAKSTSVMGTNAPAYRPPENISMSNATPAIVLTNAVPTAPAQ